MLNTLLRPQAARTLPRESRDTLFVLAVIAWVVALQAAHIPWWTSALTAGVLAWRAHLALRAQPLPGWPWRLALLLLTLGATFASHGTLLGQDAGVTLIVVLLALKTLELRARRDAFVVFFLGFFTLLTHFFYSQSLLTAGGILIALLGLLTALVNAHMPVGQPPLAQAARIAAAMALLGAPVMLVLFLLFPRMSPLWGTPGQDPSARSGLSDEMRVGAIAQLALDDSIALRVRFDTERPPAPPLLYFRGPVFGEFDGQEWRPLASVPAREPRLPAELRTRGAPVSYQVTLEPQRRPWLFLLEAATQAPELPEGLRTRMSAELQWTTQRPIQSLLRYRAESWLDFSHGPLQPVPALQDYRRLPSGFNPRTLALAQAMRAEHGAGAQADAALVQAALQRLRSGGYRYTLEPGVYGRHSADEFWFDRREGFCEHIASAFAVLMRALDIPARVVTGYQGGEINPVDGQWTVRQRDAHAWTEVWLQGQGWVRVDPTGAVSPGRIGALQRLQAPTAGFAGAFANTFGNPTLLAQLRATWEAVNSAWNQRVLDYTQGRQLNLLRALGFASPSWQDLALVLIGVVVLLSLVGALWALWERQQHDPWLRLLQRARRRLAERGVASGEAMAPRELARRVRETWGDDPAAQALAGWLLRLEALRYARQSPDSLAQLRRDWGRLPWPPRRGA